MSVDDNSDLRKAVLAFLNPAPKAPDAILPAGTQTKNRTPEELQVMSDAYISCLLNQVEPRQWTPEQREHVREAAARAAQAWQEGREQ